ncbi:hypothetical protein QBC40DRAFT_251167 [Triangularia verruculosa]|uniref:Uncharacterized protein n=1 Tax=Triangularia verruculosa TaxID=2587418 RepID=A0AAN7AW46_9PEZI|nr:hypothetical protein QBC40DRAFT_251167 [Triangularia verruculosa]
MTTVQAPDPDPIPAIVAFHLHSNEKDRHIPQKLSGHIVLHTADFRTLITNKFQLCEHHLVANSSAIYRLRDDEMTHKARLQGFAWKRTWEIQSEEQEWAGEISKYGYKDDMDLCHGDVVSWLTTVCVIEVAGYRKTNAIGGGIYRTVASWARKACNDSAEAPNFCLIDGLENPCVRWWSWKIKGKVYTGDHEVYR